MLWLALLFFDGCLLMIDAMFCVCWMLVGIFECCLTSTPSKSQSVYLAMAVLWGTCCCPRDFLCKRFSRDYVQTRSSWNPSFSQLWMILVTFVFNMHWGISITYLQIKLRRAFSREDRQSHLSKALTIQAFLS